MEICEAWLKKHTPPSADGTTESVLKEYIENWYWVKATMGEVYTALGDTANAAAVLEEADSKAPESYMKASTMDQINKLLPLLSDSPLKYLNQQP